MFQWIGQTAEKQERDGPSLLREGLDRGGSRSNPKSGSRIKKIHSLP